jgi:hypothetical protein
VVPLGVRAEERDRILCPIGREHVRASEGRGKRRQAEARAELEDSNAREIAGTDDVSEGDAARPELRPVGQELVLVEGALVDQLVGARRPQQGDLPACDLDDVFDQRAA